MTPAQKSARRASLLLLSVFVGIYSSCAEKTSLRCSRADGVCLLTHQRLLGNRETRLPVAHLLGAHVESSPGVGREIVGRTILDTRQGPLPFEVWISRERTDFSSPVNDFVKRPQQASLDVTYDTRLRTFGSGSFLLLGSLLLFGISFMKGVTSSSGRRRA